VTTETKALPAAARLPGLGWRRFGVAFVVSLAALFVVATLIAFGYARLHDGRVLPGVSVAHVSLAGLNPSQATAELRRRLPGLGEGQLRLRVGGVESVIPYASIGRDFDLGSVIDQAMGVGRAGNPLEQLAQQIRTVLAGGVSLEPSVIYDTTELLRRVQAVVAEAQVAPVNARISLEGDGFVAHPATDGQAVELDAVLRQAMAAVGTTSAADTSVTVQPRVVPAAIPSSAAEAAVERTRAVASSPLMLAIAAETSAIAPQTLLEWIALEEISPGNWQLEIDRQPIELLVAQLKVETDQPAVDAHFGFERGEPVAVPGQIGHELDGPASAEAILAALNGRASGTPTPSVTLPVVSTTPGFSTEEAEALVGRVEILGQWKTNYVPSPSNFDGVNIRRPASLIDGYVVQPSEVFDFVGVAGPITEANGYGEGAAIIHGKTRAEGVLGGGLCSASTTMYNAALRAGLQMGARRNHAYYISRYPVGLDATIWISGSYVQTMSFTNDTEYPILVRGINKKRSVTFQVWGVPDGRKVTLSEPVISDERDASQFYVYTDELAPRETKRLEYAADGFKSVVTRTVRDANGNIIHQDTMRSNYRKVDGLVLLGRYPSDPPAGTRIPYGELPPAPEPDPTPEPPPPDPEPTPEPPPPDPEPTPDPTPEPTPTPEG
jgi:vancomycin resistance protein YoaR